jgi:hypothetical protein
MAMRPPETLVSLIAPPENPAVIRKHSNQSSNSKGVMEFASQLYMCLSISGAEAEHQQSETIFLFFIGR